MVPWPILSSLADNKLAAAGAFVYNTVPHSNLPALPALLPAAHGTNVDGAWIRANVPRQLSKGSTIQFGASTRQYTVAKLPNPVAGR